MSRATRCASILPAFAPALVAWAAFAVASAAPLVSGGGGGREDARADPLRQAQELVAAKDLEGAARLLSDRLRRGSCDGATCELYARTLGSLGRSDECAHWYEEAVRRYEAEGKDALARQCQSGVRRADALAARREAFFARLSSTLAECAGDLVEQGHDQRAIEILERLPALASGKTAARVDELLTKARAASERLDLDGAAKSAGAPRALVEFESKHYKLAANLENETAQRVAELMDDLHGFYVQVHFDGDEKKARSARPRRIHPDRADMLKSWQGGAPPEGWWSPGENTVHCYDSRTNGSGSLDWMLETLFHEASHQFMSLASQGGFVPAWFNEGTASFFEGTVAMADHRVLWPEAARLRLQPLLMQLRTGSLDARTVVSFDAPGSYPAEYYSFGWGLVYFLQQYEDPATLEYVYRPLYARYRSEIVKRGSDPLKVFEDVFLGKNSPLGHQGFADFDRDWQRWIREEVGALDGADQNARKLRLERFRRDLDAANAAAKEGRKARVGEAELLARALSHLEYVRTRIDKPEHPDAALVVEQAEILERLGRSAAAAPLYQQALDLADQGRLALDEKRYAELEKRLKKLDSKNAALRTARARMLELARTANALLADYEKSDLPLVLRSYTFSALAAGALPDDRALAAAATRLRDAAREHGLLLGSIRELAAESGRWKTVFRSPPERFEPQSKAPELVSVRMSGYVLSGLEARGEYEVRAKLVRAGKIELGACWGLVVAGRENADWYLAGIDDNGQAGLWTVRVSTNGGSAPKRLSFLRLETPVAPEEQPRIAAHVYPDGRIEIRVGDRKPVEARLPLDGAVARNAGIFVKNGAAAFEELLLEQFP